MLSNRERQNKSKKGCQYVMLSNKEKKKAKL